MTLASSNRYNRRQSIACLLLAVMWSVQAWSSIRNSATVIDLAESFPELARAALSLGLLTLVIIAVLMWFSRTTPLDIGLELRTAPVKRLVVGIGLGVATFVLASFVISPIAAAVLAPWSGPSANLIPLFSRSEYLPVWILIAVFKGGFVEELWRSFGIHQFGKRFGSKGMWWALALSSVVFALGHSYQGLGGVVTTGIEGSLYGVVFIYRRSALEVIVAHGLRDVISVLFAYALY